MRLNEYQKKAITTKIYDNSVAIPYVILGICGESAELYEKIDETCGDKNFSDLSLLSKETVDVVWYLAAWAEENGLKLEDIEELSKLPIEESITDLMSDLVIYSGQIAEYAKKALRDNFDDISNGVYPTSKMDATNLATSNLLRTIRGIISYYNLDFNTCLQENIDKLASRARRGVLGGSGDVR